MCLTTFRSVVLPVAQGPQTVPNMSIIHEEISIP